MKKNPDSAIFKNNDGDDNSQRYGRIKEAFTAVIEDDIFSPIITDHDFRSSIENKDIGYVFYVFDIRYQKILESAQPIRVDFNFPAINPAGIIGYVLVLTNKLGSKSSDERKLFALISV